MLNRPTMRAAVYRGEHACRIEELPLPQGDGLLVAVEHCGICGTDLTIHKGMHPRAKPGLVLGHEFVGRVLEDGKVLSAGDRVVCFPLIECGSCEPCRSGLSHVCKTLRLYGIDASGGMAEAVRIPEDNLLRIDDRLDGAVAAQIEPVAVCIHAARRAGDLGGKDVLIVGAGPIGATLGLVLRQFGVRTTTLIEPNADRARSVEALGLQVTGDVEHRLGEIGREGFDVVFECAGVPQAFDLAVRSVGNGGAIIVVSIHKAPAGLDLQDVCFREISVAGARVYTRDDFESAIAMMEGLAPSLKSIVSDMVDLEMFPQSIARLAQGAPDLKIIVNIENRGK